MKIAPIVDRLKAKGLVRVYGALELAGLEKEAAHLPARFVVPQGWNAQPNRYAGTRGVTDQKTLRGFGVVSVLNGVGLDEARVSDELAEEEDRILDALCGWTHPEASSPFEADQGRLLSAGGRTLQWLITLRASSHIRKEGS